MDNQPIKRSSLVDFFLALGILISFYWFIGAFVSLAFNLIDFIYPDPASGTFWPSVDVWLLSSVVVLFPIAFALLLVAQKLFKREPAKRTNFFWRTLVYLTLFLTIGILAGDLIAILNSFFGGELTARFGWKVLTLAVVMLVALLYWLLELKPGWRRAYSGKIFAAIGSLAVIALVVLAFNLNGSPQTARERRLDSQRLNDLQMIQNSVVNYWQDHQTVPKSFADLNSYEQPAVDPETGEAYRYQPTAANAFELCANFKQVSYDWAKPRTVKGDYLNDWRHPSGDFCFKRTIDLKAFTAYRKGLIRPLEIRPIVN